MTGSNVSIGPYPIDEIDTQAISVSGCNAVLNLLTDR